MKPKTIGIGGSHSGVGKTTVAVEFLKHLTNPPSSLFAKGGAGGLWGAIKYTKTAIYSSIIDDPEILAHENKDTGRFLAAGAEAVLWVQSPPEELSDIIPLAIDRLSHLSGLIIEGNSAIEFLKPDIVIFISERDTGFMKGSAVKVLDMADIIIVQEDHAKELPVKAKKFKIDFSSMAGFDECLNYLHGLLG